MKRKGLLALWALCLCVVLAGCVSAAGETLPAAGTAAPAVEESLQEVTLYADFSAVEGMEATGVQTLTVSVPHVTAQELAAQLSQWTGLDFTLQAVSTQGAATTVDWAAASSLLTGLEGETPAEGFRFSNTDGLRWFMLDSLCRTLQENLGVQELHYTMDGGRDLTLAGLEPVCVFPAQSPYQGSAYYFAQAEAAEEAAPTQAPQEVSLTNPPRLTRAGSGNQTVEERDDGPEGYYIVEMTGDGMSTVINCCRVTDQGEEESLEGYLERVAEAASETEVRGLVAEESASYTQRFAYPAYSLSWRTGGEEDTRRWDALVLMTDTHTYLYALSTGADFVEAREETWQEVAEALYLEPAS